MSAAGERVEDWLAERMRACGFFRRYPQYAAVVASFVAVDDPSVDVMAISASGGRFYLHVHRSFFEANAYAIAGVLLHEVHHAVLGHVTNVKYRGAAHPKIMELAMEISANEYIRERLPPHVALEDYARFGLREGQSTLERYALLVAGRARLGASFDCVDDHAVGGFVEGGTRAGQSAESGAREGSATTDALAEARLRTVVATALREDGRRESALWSLIGVAPGDHVEILDGVDRAPKKHVDWRHALRDFVGATAVSSYTYAHPSRRFPTRIGEVPGRRRRITLAKKRQRILVAIDTSGSMSREELEEIARQLRTLRAHAELVIAECDAEVQRVYAFDREVRDVRGRGGTDLRPVFELELLVQYRVDGVVYFTDGGGPWPSEAPALPVLWVLTNDSTSFACAWGSKVEMRSSDRSR